MKIDKYNIRGVKRRVFRLSDERSKDIRVETKLRDPMCHWHAMVHFDHDDEVTIGFSIPKLLSFYVSFERVFPIWLMKRFRGYGCDRMTHLTYAEG